MQTPCLLTSFSSISFCDVFACCVVLIWYASRSLSRGVAANSYAIHWISVDTKYHNPSSDSGDVVGTFSLTFGQG